MTFSGSGSSNSGSSNSGGDYGVVLVTAASQTDAEALAEALIAAKLAACVNLFPVRSVYVWKQEVCRDQEWQLLIKTRLSLFPQLEVKIRELHSYQTPEIIALPIVAGSQPYLDWLAAQV
ncbi:MAG: divalent-cation tolerance protein CutA [Elainella sp.]